MSSKRLTTPISSTNLNAERLRRRLRFVSGIVQPRTIRITTRVPSTARANQRTTMTVAAARLTGL